MPGSRTAASGAPAVSVILALVVVQFTFSGLHLFGKVVLEAVEPLALAALRVLFATPLLLAMAWRHDRILPPRADLPKLMLLGLLGVFLNQILFISGLRWTTATNAAILMTSIPVLAVGAATLLGVERIGWRRGLGVALAVLGALVVLEPSRVSISTRGALGDLLVLANCVSFSFFLVIQRPLLERLPWRTLLAWSFVFGGSGVVVVGARQLAATPWSTLSAPVLLGIAYIALFPTVLGYSLNTWAVRRSSPVTVAVATTLQPLITALAAVPLLGDRPGWPQAAGFVLIASGLVWSGRRRAAVPEPAARS